MDSFKYVLVKIMKMDWQRILSPDDPLNEFTPVSGGLVPNIPPSFMLDPINPHHLIATPGSVKFVVEEIFNFQIAKAISHPYGGPGKLLFLSYAKRTNDKYKLGQDNFLDEYIRFHFDEYYSGVLDKCRTSFTEHLGDELDIEKLTSSLIKRDPRIKSVGIVKKYVDSIPKRCQERWEMHKEVGLIAKMLGVDASKELETLGSVISTLLKNDISNLNIHMKNARRDYLNMKIEKNPYLV